MIQQRKDQKNRALLMVVLPRHILWGLCWHPWSEPGRVRRRESGCSDPWHFSYNVMNRCGASMKSWLSWEIGLFIPFPSWTIVFLQEMDCLLCRWHRQCLQPKRYCLDAVAGLESGGCLLTLPKLQTCAENVIRVSVHLSSSRVGMSQI